LVSKPPTIGKLASHGNERPKTRRIKENGEHEKRRAPKVVLDSRKMP